MALPANPPLVVPKTRTTKLGSGATLQKDTFRIEVNAQSAADVQWMMRNIASSDVGEQMRLGNPPSLIEIDGKSSKGFDEAKRKIVVLFGSVLAAQAMRLVESELVRNINASTTPRSGRLASVQGSWQWLLIRKGSAVEVSSATALPPFTRGMMLVLTPWDVPYATAVNSRIKGTGRLMTKPGTRKRKPAVSKPIGFLGATVNALRRHTVFAQFAIRVEFTTAYKVPGEVYRHGTGQIVIKPRTRTSRRP